MVDQRTDYTLVTVIFISLALFGVPLVFYLFELLAKWHPL